MIVIAGPTASGKSALAVDLAERLDGVVINADAMQVYRELHVLTARPGPDDLRRAPHRLYGTVPAGQACSAAQWRDWAIAEIDAAHAAGRRAIVVGGTGLYIRTLMRGIAAIPPVPADIRERCRAELLAHGAPALHARLAEVDPTTAARLSTTDGQRIVRAWEVWHATSRPLSAWQADPLPEVPYRFAAAILLPPRAWVVARVDARVPAMVAAGAVDEVAALVAADLDPGLPAMRALGVPQFRDVVGGAASLETAIAGTQSATRAYAKRQSTWFRHQLATHAGVLVVEEQENSKRLGLILSKVT